MSKLTALIGTGLIGVLYANAPSAQTPGAWYAPGPGLLDVIDKAAPPAQTPATAPAPPTSLPIDVAAAATPAPNPGAPATYAPGPTLLDAVDVALENRLEIKSAQQRVEGLRARVRQVMSRNYPWVDFLLTTERVVNYDLFSGVTARVNIFGQDTTVAVERTIPRYTAVPALRLTYDAYTGGRTTAALDSSRAVVRSGEAEALIASRNVVRDVALTYLRVRRVALQRAGAAAWVQHYTERQETAAVRLAEGRASELEYRSEGVALAQRKAELRRADRDMQARLLDYWAAVGVEPPANPDAIPRGMTFRDNVDYDLETVGKWADATVELTKSEADVEAAQHRIRAERADFRPQLKVYAQYTGVGRADSDVFNAYGSLQRRDYFVGFTLSYNLFSGFNSTAKVEEALAESTRAELELERSRRILRQNTRKLELAVEQESATIDLAQERRELATLRLKVMQAKYAADLDAKIALEQAVIEDADAQRALDIAKIDQAIARLRLMFASTADVN